MRGSWAHAEFSSCGRRNYSRARRPSGTRARDRPGVIGCEIIVIAQRPRPRSQSEFSFRSGPRALSNFHYVISIVKPIRRGDSFLESTLELAERSGRDGGNRGIKSRRRVYHFLHPRVGPGNVSADFLPLITYNQGLLCWPGAARPALDCFLRVETSGRKSAHGARKKRSHTVACGET